MPSDEMIIRRASVSDARAMAAVHVAAWRGAYAGILSADALAAMTVEAQSDCWRAVLRQSDPSVTHLVARRSGGTIGIASVGAPRDERPDSGWCELRMINIHPDFWGDGVGSALHDHCLLTLTARGYHTAYMWVVTANARARNFCAQRGWVEDGQQRQDAGVQPYMDQIRLQHSLVHVPSARRTPVGS